MAETQIFALWAMFMVGGATVAGLFVEGHYKSAWAVGAIFCGPAIVAVWLKAVLG